MIGHGDKQQNRPNPLVSDLGGVTGMNGDGGAHPAPNPQVLRTCTGN